MNMPEPTDVTWRTSSYSGGQGNCIEVGWRTSSHPAGEGNCVEIANAPENIQVRDTKDRPGGTLTVSLTQWNAFITKVRR
jgi:hypothetical protein